MTADLMNGLFEAIGGVMIGLSCRRLYLDKQVKGILIWPVLFFTTWGFFNTYLYPSVNLMWSFWGGLCPLVTNVVWLGMFLYYRCKKKPLIDCIGLKAKIVAMDKKGALDEKSI